MTNKIFIDALAEKTGMTKKATIEFCDSFETVLKTILSSEATKADEDRKSVKVVDFTFSVKDVPARNGVNPATSEKIVIPATKKVSIKASNDVKTVIKG